MTEKRWRSPLDVLPAKLELDERERRLAKVIAEDREHFGVRPAWPKDARARERLFRRMTALAETIGHLPLDVIDVTKTKDDELTWIGDEDRDRPVIRQDKKLYVGSQTGTWTFVDGRLRRYERGEVTAELTDGFPEELTDDAIRRLALGKVGIL